MSDGTTITVMLAGGGDERVAANSLSYIRRALDFEAIAEPEANSAVFLRSLKLTSKTSPSDLASQFGAAVEIVTVSASDNSLLFVRGRAVIDVDDAPSTVPGANSWLVFGVGPTAPRLGVRQTRDQLREIWNAAGLDPEGSGI